MSDHRHLRPSSMFVLSSHPLLRRFYTFNKFNIWDFMDVVNRIYDRMRFKQYDIIIQFWILME